METQKPKRDPVEIIAESMEMPVPQEDSPQKKRLRYWLSWIGVLPAALIGLLAGGLLSYIFSYPLFYAFVPSPSDLWLYEVVKNTAAAGFGGYFMIAAAYNTAPEGKLVTALVLVGLVLLLLGFNLAVNFSFATVWSSVVLVGAAIGAVVVMWMDE